MRLAITSTLTRTPLACGIEEVNVNAIDGSLIAVEHESAGTEAKEAKAEAREERLKPGKTPADTSSMRSWPNAARSVSIPMPAVHPFINSREHPMSSRNMVWRLTVGLSIASCIALASAAPVVAAAQAASYHVLATHQLGGDGGWDYLALDTAGNRLFIARSDRIMVVDPDKGTVLGEIPGLDRAHGIAFAYAAGHGFATSGADSTVTMFDLATLEVLGHTIVGVDDDAILYDPASTHVFTMNGDAGTASVLDAATGKRLGTIPLGGRPEFGVSDGAGKVYVNLEDKSAIVELDPKTLKVMRRWSIAPCESPTGLALDAAHERLFSVCRNRIMAISDVRGGKLDTTVPIGRGVDGARFDPATGDAFASNGEGSLTVVHEVSPDRFEVVQTVATISGARTMELDPRNHRVYVVGAKFGDAPALPTASNPRRRPPMLPGSFTLLVLAR